MLALTIAKGGCAPSREVAAVPLPGAAIAGWLTRVWRDLVRHAERPGRVVPYC
jgi:hypothetical protein